MADRSPNYPALDLREAIGKIDELQKKAGRSRISSIDAIKALGYTGKTGSSLRAIASLRQYGLVEGTKDQVHVSELARQILFPTNKDSPEYLAVIQKAASSPRIFGELLAEFAEIPDDAIIQSHLIHKKEFTPEAAAKCVKTFRETINFAKLGRNVYNPTQENRETTGFSTPSQEKTVDQKHVDSEWNKVFTCPISDETTATLTITGERPKIEELDILWAYLDIVKRSLGSGRKPKESTQSDKD